MEQIERNDGAISAATHLPSGVSWEVASAEQKLAAVQAAINAAPPGSVVTLP